jgi:hypothetical protein
MVDRCEADIASRLVHQCLHLLFLKYDGAFDRLHAFTEVLEENLYPSLESRLPSLEYEKVFHLYLLSTLDQKVAFRKELKKVIARGIERVNSFLDEVFTQRDSDEKALYREIILHPSALKGYS